MNVKRILLLVAAGCGAIALGLQQQPQKYVLINDNTGGFKVFDVESALTSFAPGGDVEFEASGRPVRGFSKEQGLTFSANKLEGIAARTGQGSFRLKEAKASGGVVIDVHSEDSEGTSDSHLESASVTMKEDADSTNFTFPSAFVFANRAVTPEVNRFFELRAPSGTFEMPLLDRASGQKIPFKNANVPGPVNIVINRVKKQADGEYREDLILRADRLTFDGATRTLKLEGNIVYTIVTKPITGRGLNTTFTSTMISIPFLENGDIGIIEFGIGSATVTQGGGQ